MIKFVVLWIYHIPFLLQHTLKSEAVVDVRFLNNDQSDFVCGNSENLVCETDPGVDSMSWRINGQEQVSCDIFVCPANQETADYVFTFDRPAGLFDLEIKHVTQSDNGTVYACNDGTDSDSLTAVVQVMDDFVSTKTEPASNNGGGNTELIVTTGCLNPGTARNTQFEWTCIPDSGSDQKEISFGITTRENGTVCTTDPDCGIAGLVQIEATLTSNITNNDDGELCSISVLVSYGGSGGNETIVFDTNIRIKFNSLPNTTPTTEANANNTHADTPTSQSNTIYTNTVATSASNSMMHTSTIQIPAYTEILLRNLHVYYIQALVCSYLSRW